MSFFLASWKRHKERAQYPAWSCLGGILGAVLVGILFEPTLVTAFGPANFPITHQEKTAPKQVRPPLHPEKNQRPLVKPPPGKPTGGGSWGRSGTDSGEFSSSSTPPPKGGGSWGVGGDDNGEFPSAHTLDMKIDKGKLREGGSWGTNIIGIGEVNPTKPTEGPSGGTIETGGTIVTPGPSIESLKGTIVLPNTPQKGSSFSPPTPTVQSVPWKVKDLSTDNPAMQAPSAQPRVRTEPRGVASAAGEQQPKQRKVVRPKVHYLNELALDIDPLLVQLAGQAPGNTVELYRTLLSQAVERKDLPAQHRFATNLGHVYYLTGQLGRATACYEQSLATAKTLSAPGQEADAWRNLGASLTASAHYRRGVQCNEKAFKLLNEGRNVQGTQMILNNMGVLEKNRGRFDRAGTWFLRALEASRESNPIRHRVLVNLGNLYWRVGDYLNALETLEKAVRLAQEINDPAKQGADLLRIAEIQREAGRYQEAVVSAERSLQAHVQAGVPADLVLKLMGDVYLDAGKLGKAEQYVKKADYDASLGRYFLMKRDYASARKHYESLLAADEEHDIPDALFAGYTGLGEVYEAQGDFAKAQEFYADAVQVTEQMRSGLLMSERKNFFSVQVDGFSRCRPAKALIRLFLKEDLPERSIYPGEVTRARGFADDLAQRAEGSQFGVPQEVLETELEITDKLAALKNSLHAVPEQGDSSFSSYVSEQVRQAEKAFQDHVAMIRERFKEYAAVRYPAPVTLEQASIDPQEYVIVFDQAGDGIGIRLIKGKKIVKACFRDWKAEEQEKEVRAFRLAFERARLRDFDTRSASSLYRKLLADMIELVPKGQRLVIIPDGTFALIPFEGLVCGGNAKWKKGPHGDYPDNISYVGDHHPIVYYQSLTAMTLVRTLSKRRSKNDNILVMADPIYSADDSRAEGLTTTRSTLSSDGGDRSFARLTKEMGMGNVRLQRLNLTQELAEDIQRLYNPRATVNIGASCTKSAFLEKIRQDPKSCEAIVFATHGFATNQVLGVMEPFLALSTIPTVSDALLTMSEIAGLKLDSDLAALIACQTGTGFKLAGEGVMSMGRAFQCAGSRSVLMSLWSVYEPSTVILMKEFFAQLRQGKTKIQSLIAARTHVRKEGFEHPFFWAAFVIQGEPE